jgi:hypothetical protein
VGLFIPPPGVPGAAEVTTEKLNRIWSELAPRYGYTQLQASPDGAAAQFLGASPDVGITIQPPLIQFRDAISMTPEQSAENAQDAIKTVARSLGTDQFFNLGVKHVYNAPLENNDAKGFILNKLVAGTEALEELNVGGESWAGITHVISQPQGVYTLNIEPLQADQMKSLFIDLDAQFPGPVTLDAIKDRAGDAKDFLTSNVVRYHRRNKPGRRRRDRARPRRRLPGCRRPR